MQRRTVLAITASGLGILAGCVSGGRSGADAPDQLCTIETPSNSNPPVSTNTESFLETYLSDKPRTEIVIGDEQAQCVDIPDMRIENETSASHSVPSRSNDRYGSGTSYSEAMQPATSTSLFVNSGSSLPEIG